MFVSNNKFFNLFILERILFSYNCKCFSLPEKRREEETEDEPAEILVPQVKVGPNGQLIIDEQSLVIDQYKAQENIDRSDIIVDEDTNGNGFYKRRQKSKEWSKWETMKFYKALSTYGTDFLLMQSVFPKRTRQELKLKYKKEERLNHPLVEKALKYQEFDTEALEKDLGKQLNYICLNFKNNINNIWRIFLKLTLFF